MTLMQACKVVQHTDRFFKPKYWHNTFVFYRAGKLWLCDYEGNIKGQFLPNQEANQEDRYADDYEVIGCGALDGETKKLEELYKEMDKLKRIKRKRKEDWEEEFRELFQKAQEQLLGRMKP
jgi:hypothetical protein